MTGFLCAGSLTVLADRGLAATVKCPLDGAVFEKAKYHGQVCPVCGMCKLGEDVLGLSIQLEQPDAPTMYPGSTAAVAGAMAIQTALDGGPSQNDLLF